MTKDEYNKKLNLVFANDQEDWISKACLLTDGYIDELLAEIAKLQEDNKNLVEQMNAMAIKYESLEQHCTALEEDINMWQTSGAMPKGVK